MKKKQVLFAILFLILCPLLLPARNVVIPAGTPFFTDRSLKARTGITAMESFETEEVPGGERHGWFLQEKILYPVDIMECRLPGLEGTYWFSPQVKEDSQRIPRVSFRYAWNFFLPGILQLVLFAFGAVLLRRTGPGTVKRCFLLAVMAALLHGGLLSLVLWKTGQAIQIFSDDAHYLVASQMLCSGSWAGTMFRYTIGFPIICMPFVVMFSPVHAFYEFIPAIAFMNGFLISSLTASCVFLLLRRLSGSDLLSFGGVAAWQIFLFFFYSQPMRHLGGEKLVKTFPYIPQADPCDIMEVSRSSGYNAMSDPASALGTVLCFLTILYLKRPLIPLSLLFGFLCLIRINNIFFAPVLLFLLLLKYRELLKKKGAFLLFSLLGALGFLLVFSAQFVVNYRQFGNPFVFPYVLHPNHAAEGFLLTEFPAGFLYTCLWNNVCLAWALPSLLLMRDRLQRTVLVLAVMPLMLFLSGYAEWRSFDMRGMIPLWPFLFAAPFFSDWWKNVPKTVLYPALGAAVSTSFLAAVPVWFDLSLPWHLEQVPHGNIIAIVLLGFELAFLLFALIRARPYPNLFLFLAMFSLSFHCGTAFCGGILTAALCVLAVKDLIHFLRAGAGSEIPFLLPVPAGWAGDKKINSQRDGGC